jgi:hypothetical protein
MDSSHSECLHCFIVKEIGRRLDKGEICGRSALDKLVLVMADLLALVSFEEVEEAIKGVLQDLSEAAVLARQDTASDRAFPLQC